MVATLCLLQCVLVTAQTPERPTFGPPTPVVTPPVIGAGVRPPQPPPGRGGFTSTGADWLLVPRLSASQELVYRGTYAEEAGGSGVRFNRTYRVENRVLVLDAGPQTSEAAVLTVLRQRGPQPGAGSPDGTVSSVRVETVRVDGQGRLKANPGAGLTVPLDGPPTIECGVFVEVPRQRVSMDQTWETLEEGRPVRSWSVAGTELINATSCVKLVGVQQSDDWEKPRADRGAWRREDTVWVAPRLGIAYRVKRVIERRDAGRREADYRTVLEYELESSLPYPRQLFEDRRDEIRKARQFAENAAPLLDHPGKYGPQLDAVLAKINHHVEHQTPTPYREAVLMVKRRVEAAKRGESAPAAAPSAVLPAVANIGQAAPDFVATDLITRTSARLRKLTGRPLLMVFYNPTSVTAEDLLRFAQGVQDAHAGKVTVLGLAMSDDAERVRQQHDALKVTFPILNGSGLRQSYAVETTPKVIVLDERGTVCCSQLGWGEETPATVLAELRRCLLAK